MSKLSKLKNIKQNWHFWKHILAVLLFVVISCTFCRDVFDGKRIHSHDNTQFKGMAKELGDFRKANNEEPLWTNSMFGGMPTYQISTVYPNNLLKQLDFLVMNKLPRPLGYVSMYMLGFYILLIVLKVPWRYAFAGSVAFAFSTYFIIILEAGHNTKANSIGHVAPLIAGVILSYRGKYLIGLAVTSLFLGLNIAANHVQVTYYAGLCVVILVIVELVKAIKQKALKRFIFGSLTSLSALLLALLVNNTNLRLTNDFVGDTQRGISRLEIKARKTAEAEKLKDANNTNQMTSKKAYATNWSYGVQELFTLLIPDFNGGGSSDAHHSTKTYKTIKKIIRRQNPSYSNKEVIKNSGTQTGSILYWGDQPGVNGPVYIGAGIVLLFVLGLIFVKSEYKWWLLITALLGLFISLGKNFSPFFHFMFDYFPIYDKFRALTIGMVLTEFAVPLLGFLFLKELLSGELDKARVYKVSLITTGILSTLLIVFYFGAENIFSFKGARDSGMGPEFLRIIKGDRIEILKSDTLRSLLFVLLTGFIVLAISKESIKKSYLAICLCFICLFDLCGVSTRYLNSSSYVRKSKIIKPFPERTANLEIAKDKTTFRVFNASQGVGHAINDASTSFYHHTIGGYSSAKLMNYQDLLDYSLGKDMQRVISGLGEIQKTFGGLPQRAFDDLCSGTNLINMLNTKYVIVNKDYPPLKNNNAFGNAWLVERIKTYTSPDSVMFNLPFQNLKEVALAESSDVIGLEGNSYKTDGVISLIEYKPNHLTYEFTSKEDAYAVFSEINFKGWESYIDGENVKHNKVNYTLRGLEIPSGKHKVEFKFHPKIYYQGEIISLFSSLFVLGLFLVACFKILKQKNIL